MPSHRTPRPFGCPQHGCAQDAHALVTIPAILALDECEMQQQMRWPRACTSAGTSQSFNITTRAHRPWLQAEAHDPQIHPRFSTHQKSTKQALSGLWRLRNAIHSVLKLEIMHTQGTKKVSSRRHTPAARKNTQNKGLCFKGANSTHCDRPPVLFITINLSCSLPNPLAVALHCVTLAGRSAAHVIEARLSGSCSMHDWSGSTCCWRRRWTAGTARPCRSRRVSGTLRCRPCARTSRTRSRRAGARWKGG